MTSKQIMIVIALMAICAWSTVMALLGQLAAVAALVPSLGLLVQQVAQALASTDSQTSAPGATDAQAAEGGASRAAQAASPGESEDVAREVSR